MGTACHDKVIVALGRSEGGISADEKENLTWKN
jgi:hypothetical protein